MTTNQTALLLTSVILLNAYSFGAGCVERFVNYQTWPLLADARFGRYHRAQQPYILAFIVAPLALGFLLQGTLLVTRPAGVSPLVAWTLVVTSAVGALSTIFLQIPLHRTLDRGYAESSVKRLLLTDWIRRACDVARILATTVLLYRLLERLLERP